MTTEQVEFGGIKLAASTALTLCIGAANRDPAQILTIRKISMSAAAQPASGVRHRRASMRRDGAGASRRGDRDFAIPGRFPGYALSGAPVRGGRVRFRGFLSVPCTIG